jgi:hypothetical protein
MKIGNDYYYGYYNHNQAFSIYWAPKKPVERGIRFKKQIHHKRKAKAIPWVNRFNISLLFLTSDIAVGEHLMQSKAKIEDVFVGYE